MKELDPICSLEDLKSVGFEMQSWRFGDCFVFKSVSQTYLAADLGNKKYKIKLSYNN